MLKGETRPAMGPVPGLALFVAGHWRAMTINKDHWYDGWFYDRWIAPNQDRLFGQIKDLIEPNSRVLDVGCGTGRLAFSLADRCEGVLGIDLSRRNIERANRRLSSAPDSRISFEHRSVTDIATEGKRYFDYAVLTYVLHEVEEHERAGLLQDVSRVAGRIILGDYRVPRTVGLFSALDEVVEFAAGRDHYTNFKSFVANGGIRRLVEAEHFEVIEDIPHSPLTSHLVMLQPRRR